MFFSKKLRLASAFLGVAMLGSVFAGCGSDAGSGDTIKVGANIEMTGNQSKIDAFIGLLDGYEILEVARTGLAGLGRGNNIVKI